MSNFKLNKKHFLLFCSECKKYQKSWGVNGWDLSFEFVKLEQGDYAQVVRDYEQHAVIISLNKNWSDKEPTAENLQEIAKHEMLHILMARIWGMAHLRFVSEDELKAAEHEIVNKLMDII